MSLFILLGTSISFLTMTYSGVPVNNNCEDAIVISNGDTPFSNINATTDGPIHADCAVASDGGQTGNDIWYLYTATETGTVTISTCDTADFDTDLVLYDSSTCKTLTLLACNDDGDDCSGYTSYLEADVISGLTYLLRVGGYAEGDVGTGTISISITPDSVSWIGKDGDSWFDEENWSSGEVPESDTDLIISGSVVIDSPGAVSHSVLVTKGGKIRLSSTSSSLTASLTIAEGGTLQWDAGTIDISNGTLDISDDLYIGCNESAALIADVGYIYADTVTVCDNGEISGYFRAYTDNFINHGIIELGGYYSYSKIYGNFEQSEDGTLITSIGSATSYKRLNVDDGTTTIAGTLICNSENGYSPPDSASFLKVVNNYDNLHNNDGFDFIIANGFAAGTNVAQTVSDGGIDIDFSVDTIWYVDSDASIGNTGTSWADAFPSPQLAFPNASQGDQVWIKQGTYTPAFVPGSGAPGTDRSATFSIPNGIQVFGGFDGTETSNSQRDPEANPTILSGNIGNLGSASDDSYHVVTFAPSEWSYALLDSLSVTKGKATGPASTNDNVGAGIYNETGTLFINNCTIIENGADDYGGGLFSDDGWFYLSNCTIENNKIVDVQGGGPGFDDWGGNGGGIALTNSAGTYISECKFIDNYASYGGAIHGTSDCWLNITDSVFVTNRALQGGGAIRVNDCTFNVVDCAFNTNMTTNLVLGSGAGGAIYASESDTEIEKTSFHENSTSGFGGAIYFDSNSVTQVPFINACIFEQNTGYKGSAFYASDVSSNYVYIANSLIASNNGPAIHLSNQSSGSRITNCTIASNVDMFTSAAVTGIASIENSIIWGNIGLYGRNNIFNQINGAITLSDSIIDLWDETYNSTFPNQYVSSNDPLFRSKKGDDGIPGTGDEDFRLLPTSPAIDEGWDGSHDYPSVLEDLDGLSRFEDDPFTSNKFKFSMIDLGCYEFVPQLAEESGYRIWDRITEQGLFGTDTNWQPTEAPNLNDAVIVNESTGNYMRFNQDVTVKQFEAIYGVHDLILNGQTLKILGNKNSLNIGHHLVNGIVMELGIINGIVEADNVDVSGLGKGSIFFDEGTLRSDEPVLIRNNANIYGKGTIEADVYLAGDHLMDSVNRRYPDINGDYYLSEYPTEEITGSGKVIFYLQDYINSNGEAKFNVDGTAYLGGVLQIGAWNHTLNIGETVTILETAEGISGNFDSVLANGFRDDEVPIISIVPNATGGQSLVMTLNSISELVGFSDPDSTSLNAVPDDVELADFDGDGFVDLVLSLPDENTNSGDTDEILILFNGGTSTGEWNGFSGGSQQITVGNTPAGITTGDFDADGDIDIAVANKDDDTISALENQPNLRGNPSFVLFEIDAGYYTEETVRPADVTAGKFSNSGEMDLAIANSGDSKMVVINGPIFSASLMPSGSQNESPGGAGSIDPGDVNNDKDLDVINVSNDNGKTNSFKGTSMAAGGLGYGDPIVLDMGVTIAEQLIIDIDGNGNDDILVCDPESNAIAIALQKADGTYKTPAILALDAAQEGGGDIWYVNPKSLTAFDIDADGDLDLAIVAENNNAEKATAIYRNDSSGNLLLLSLVDEQGAGTNPILAKSGDLDSDGYEDLLMIGENADQLAGRNDYAGTTESALNDLGKSNPCPSDLNGDNYVNVDDLLLLIAAWGNTSGDEDINSDGSVNVDDMLLLIAAWGSCPR